MDSALARAARISLRGAIYRVRASAPGDASDWGWHFNIRTADSGLGIRVTSERIPRWLRPDPMPTHAIRFISEASYSALALPSEPAAGYWLSCSLCCFWASICRSCASNPRPWVSTFGEEFRDYSRACHVSPKTDCLHKDSKTKFDPGLYLRYREYQAALGLLIAWGLLILKMYYWK